MNQALTAYYKHMDCIRFAKIRNDSTDPSNSRSDSTMKKTLQVRHAFHSRKSEEYTLDLDRLYSRCFLHSRVTPRVTGITRVVANRIQSWKHQGPSLDKILTEGTRAIQNNSWTSQYNAIMF